MHYWPRRLESPEPFVCGADSGLRTSSRENVTCAGCRAWLAEHPKLRAEPVVSVPRELLDPTETYWFGPPDHPGRGGLPLAEYVSAAESATAQVCRNCPELIEQVPEDDVEWYTVRRWRHAATRLPECNLLGGGLHAEPRNAPAGDVPVIPGKDDR